MHQNYFFLSVAFTLKLNHIFDKLKTMAKSTRREGSTNVGSCDFDRAWNDKFSVEFWIFVTFMFWSVAEFWNLGHLQGILKRDIFEWIGLLLDLILMSAEKNQNKHLKFDTKFIIRLPASIWHEPHISQFVQLSLKFKFVQFYNQATLKAGRLRKENFFRS